MSEKKQEKKRKNYNPQKEKAALLLPIFFIVTILPLVIKMYQYATGLTDYEWFAAPNPTVGDQYIDLFLMYKQWCFVITAGIMLCILAVKSYLKSSYLRVIPTFIPLGIYAALSLLSTLFSKYSDYGFSGIYEQFENVFCLLGYALVVYYVYMIIETEYGVQMVIWAITIGALLMGLLGTFQALGYDFLMTDFVKKMYALSGYPIKQIGLNFDKGRVYCTLYNPNYVGVYTSLLIPFFVTLLLFSRKVKQSILYIAAIIMLVICMFGSESKAGLISLAAAFVVLMIFMRKELIKRWFIAVPVIVVLIAAFIGVNALNHNAYINAIQNAIQTRKSDVKNLEALANEENDVAVTYKGNVFRAQFQPEQETIFTVIDDQGMQIELVKNEENNTYYINDERFQGIYLYQINLETLSYFAINIDGQDWSFAYVPEYGKYKFINYYGKYADIDPKASFGFKGMESFASGRGYIWSKTIPLLKDHILLGSGADSFIFEFPHSDYVGRYNYGFYDTVMSKPHSLYLQIGVQTGAFSLIAFLVFYFMYLVDSMKLYFKHNLDTFVSQAGIAVMVGTISYMVSGISNDSSIAVAPIYWIMMGLGIAINVIVKRENEIRAIRERKKA